MTKDIEGVCCTAGVDIDDHTHTAALAAALAARCHNLAGVFSDIVCVVAFYVQTVHCQDRRGLTRQ